MLVPLVPCQLLPLNFLDFINLCWLAAQQLPPPSPSRKHVGAICVLKTGRTYQHFPFPTSSVDISVKSTEEQIAVHQWGRLAFRKAVWCTVSSVRIRGRLRLDAKFKSWAWVLFCFWRVNVAFMKSHRKVSCKSPLQKSVPKRLSPEHFTLCANHLWSYKNRGWNIQETLSIPLLLKEMSAVIHTISNV